MNNINVLEKGFWNFFCQNRNHISIHFFFLCQSLIFIFIYYEKLIKGKHGREIH